MISKKKLTAIVVAGLFVSPVMAADENAPKKQPDQTQVKSRSIIGTGGYAEGNNYLFELAIANAEKENVRKRIFVEAQGQASDADSAKFGQQNLTLKGGSYNIYMLDFSNGTGLHTANHQSNLTLNQTDLTASNGIVFRNAGFQSSSKDDAKFKADELTSNNTLTLANKSVLTGNVVNRYSSPFKVEGAYFTNGLTINTTIALDGQSQWTGDLVDIVIKEEDRVDATPVSPDRIKGNYTVQINGNSTWTGGIAIESNSKADVAVDGTSAWIANKDATVNQLRLAEGGRMTAKNSTVSVEKFAGNGNIVLDTNGVVSVNAADNKVNATFTSLEGSKFTTGDKVDANVLVAGALVDEKGMDAVIAEYNKNDSYKGNGTVTFSGGLINDTVTGKNDAQGNFVVQNVQKNAQLVSIGESTAITMMQWRADADDMYQRMGDLRNNNGAVGVWARTFGGKAEAGHVDNKYYGVQAGVDTQVATTGPKQFVGGAVSYTTGDATFANGTGDNYMGTFTGYSTWLFDNGSYVDVAAKVGKLNNEFDLAVEGKKLAGKYSTQAIALTVESGHRFPVTNLTYVEPQVAFTASHIFGEDYGATNGVTIEQDSINSYVARVGVQAGLNCPDNMGSVFVRASYLYDFDGETSTVAHKANAMDGNRFDQDFGGGWYELGLGMNVNFTKNLYGYADFEYVTGGEIKTPYRWNAGVRYAF